MGEADETRVVLGDDGVAPVTCRTSLGPDPLPVLQDIAVEKRIRIGTPVVPAPAVGMKRGNRPAILSAGRPEPQPLGSLLVNRAQATDRRLRPAPHAEVPASNTS